MALYLSLQERDHLTCNFVSSKHGAGILKQFMGAKEPSRNRVVVTVRQATQTGGIVPWIQFLGSLKVEKFGLKLLCSCCLLRSILIPRTKDVQ